MSTSTAPFKLKKTIVKIGTQKYEIVQLKHLLFVPQSLIKVADGLILDLRTLLAVTHSPQMMELTSRSQCQVALSSPPATKQIL